jgi:translation initiation factor IF-1
MASYWSMAKEELLMMEGVVEEVLRNTQFRVSTTNGARVLAYASARLRQNRVRIIAGDKVTLEISPYDLTRGRINFRHKDEKPAGAVTVRRFPPRRR